MFSSDIVASVPQTPALFLHPQALTVYSFTGLFRQARPNLIQTLFELINELNVLLNFFNNYFSERGVLNLYLAYVHNPGCNFMYTHPK